MSRESDAVMFDLAPMWHLHELMCIMVDGCDGITLYMYHSPKHKPTTFAMQHHTMMQGVLMLSYSFATSKAQTHNRVCGADA